MSFNDILSSINSETGLSLEPAKNLMQKTFMDFSRNYNASRILETPDRHPKALYEIYEDEIIGIVITNCNLVKIPDSIFKMPSIKFLGLANNKIEVINDRIETLKFIRVLDLSNNQISEIPESLYTLSELRFLNLGKNKIQIISKKISQLQKLNGLLLTENMITNIPTEIVGLKELWRCTHEVNEIMIKKNQVVRTQRFEEAASLRDVEKELYENGKTGINIDRNDVENLPPELIQKGLSKIIEYWKSLSDSESLPIDEFKLVFVGEGGAGKTSLLKRITTGQFDENEKQTHGINIRKWQLIHGDKQITANLWDFGGQEIMHSTHQFFLSNRSLYIIVIDSRREEKIRILAEAY